MKLYIRRFSSDLITPAQLLTKFEAEHKWMHCFESAEKHGNKNCYTIIAFNPIIILSVQHGKMNMVSQDYSYNHRPYFDALDNLNSNIGAVNNQRRIGLIMTSIDTLINFASDDIVYDDVVQATNFDDIANISRSIFTYFSYDFVQYTESIDLSSQTDEIDIPDCALTLYRNVIDFE